MPYKISKGKTSDTLDRLEEVFKNRTSSTLNRLGLATSDGIQVLTKRVEELTESVEIFVDSKSVIKLRAKVVEAA